MILLLEKHLAMFGYAFKKDTGDTRETAAAYVSKILLTELAHITVFDPKTSETSMFRNWSIPVV